MKQSKLFTKTKKEAPKDEVSVNAQFLIRAGFADKLMAGVYTFLPLGLRVMKKIENIIREEMNAIGGQEVSMPALQPKENWMTTGRWETMDDLYKIKDASEREFALGSTHEEVIAPLMKKFVSSYKDLPLYAYQFQNKFRMELRAKSGLLRGREFLMKDLYSFHLTEEDLDEYYEKAKEAYWKIFEKFGIKDKTYLAFASGGSFSKYSHEFQVLTEYGEDIIYHCKKCNYAQNKEIAEMKAGDKCPKCKGEIAEGKAIEVGNIFQLKTKYSEPFKLDYVDEDGKKKPVMMGCYGIGPSRVMGSVVEIHHDEKGIIWPESIAPFAFHLIQIGEEKEIAKKAEEVYNKLLDKNIEVLFDNRIELSAGQRFAEADLIGIPYRLVISKKTGGKIELKKRNEDKSKLVDISELKFGK